MSADIDLQRKSTNLLDTKSPSDKDTSKDDDCEPEDFWPSDDNIFEDSYSLSENDVYSDELDQLDLSECIRYWALKTNQSHESINLIMEIIRRKTNEKRLPRSARTLLKTSRKATAEIVKIAGGQYWYKGIRQCLSDFFR